ncbi:MAG: hypothetical protein ABR499_07095 [Gemmatimonadaceae bacterium]
MSFLRRFAPPHVLLAAAIPFVGYALAFAYERGYTGRYGLPPRMIHVTLAQAVIASVAAAILVAVTPFVARGFSRIASRWIARIVLAPAAAIAVALWAYSETRWVMGPHLLIPVALIGGFGGFAALRIYRSIVAPLMGQGGSWVDRLKGNALRGGEPRPIAALAWMGHRTRWTLALLVVALFGAHWYGNYRSRNQRDFLVSSTGPTCVVVERTAEGVICALADVTRRRVLPRLRLIAPKGKERLSLATLPTLSSPFDSDRKLFAPPRPSGTTGTVYSGRQDAPVTQAGRPAAKKATTAKKKPTATTKRRTTTTKKTTTTTRR